MQRPAKPFTPVRFRLQPPIKMKNYKKNIVLVSGGFDPLHKGHIDLINEAANFGEVLVIINNEQFLIEKKGFSFFSIDERTEIVKNLNNVFEVFISIDKDHTVSKSIEYLVKTKKYNIKYFANGGDRKNKNDIPEFEICNKFNIETLFDIGGNKVQSSSLITQKFYEKMLIINDDKKINKKPWGHYINLLKEGNYLLKKIVVMPGEELSEQLHKFREEHWIVVEGQVEVTHNEKVSKKTTGDYIHIKKESIHRVKNSKDLPAIIIEIQMGNILSESDIIRKKDKYKRLP